MIKRVFLAGIIMLCSATYALTAPKITAKSWIVADGAGRVIESQNPDQVRSIASISKLMTVMVVMDKELPLDEKIGDYTREQLIELAMVKSSNSAAQQLCESYPGGMTHCIVAMNRKARSLGLENTKFVEPTGLSVMNTSTANELVKLVVTASKYPIIVETSQLNQVKIQIRRKWIVFQNTNPIIGKRHKFIVSKTGYINASGGCIAMMLDTEVGQRIVVVLGSRNTRTRIPEAEFIAEYF